METRVPKSVSRLGPWFHNLHLPGGMQTAPNHFLGDFPRMKWLQIEPQLPRKMKGWTVLDIGCNAGFYSFELARRGAKVLGIDSDPRYLAQARWAAKQMDLPQMPEFRRMQIHELAFLDQKFDLVLFMGVFYHLRYPQLALDTVARKVRKLMIFQSLTMACDEVIRPRNDYSIMEREVFSEEGWPKMAFIEKKFSNDATNWWVPNHSAVEAMLRSSGFGRVRRVAHEIYLCTPSESRGRLRDDEEWLAATGRKRSR